MAESTDTRKGRVRNLDDFNRKAIDTTNYYTTNSDAGGTAFATNEQTNGVIRGSVDTSDNDITNLFGHDVFRLDEGSAWIEIRAKPVTSVTVDGETYLGVTDSNTTDENPILLSTTDVVTSAATDAVGFAYTGGGTANWKAVAVKADVDATPVACSRGGATTPAVGTWQTFKIALSTEGHARFWINGVEHATIESAVSTTALLNLGVAVQSGGTARSLDIDYVEMEYGRRMTA